MDLGTWLMLWLLTAWPSESCFFSIPLQAPEVLGLVGRSGGPHRGNSEASVLLESPLPEMGKTRRLSGEGSRTWGQVSWSPQPLFPRPSWPTAWGCSAGAGAVPLCPVSWQEGWRPGLGDPR